MTFQFTCPNGHLLQAEPEHVGQQSQCPACGVMMLIPEPPPQALPFAQPASGAESSLISVGNPTKPVDVPNIETGQDRPPKINVGDDAQNLSAGKPPTLFHIRCPNGHELETPREMLDQFALCPTCNAQFQLLERDSVEYQRRKAIEDEARAAKLDRNWLNWAIAIVIVGAARARDVGADVGPQQVTDVLV